MLYRNKTTGIIVSQQAVRTEYRNTSLPSGEWDQQTLEFVNMEYVESTAKPLDTEYQTAQDNGAVQIDGNWVQSWVMVDKYNAEELANYEAVKLAAQWNTVREDRNKKLAEVDIKLTIHRDRSLLNVLPFDEARPGVYNKELVEAMIQYKQELRDVTNNTDPFNITWPVNPLDRLDEFKRIWLSSSEYLELLNPDLWAGVKAQRNQKLNDTDNVVRKHNELKDLGVEVFSDTTPGVLPDDLYTEVLHYRQILRDITGTATPSSVIWPINPLDRINTIKADWVKSNPKV